MKLVDVVVEETNILTSLPIELLIFYVDEEQL